MEVCSCTCVCVSSVEVPGLPVEASRQRLEHPHSDMVGGAPRGPPAKDYSIGLGVEEEMVRTYVCVYITHVTCFTNTLHTIQTYCFCSQYSKTSMYTHACSHTHAHTRTHMRAHSIDTHTHLHYTHCLLIPLIPPLVTHPHVPPPRVVPCGRGRKRLIPTS